jgi:adenylate kinase family enzyme
MPTSATNSKRALLLLARPGGGKTTVMEGFTQAKVSFHELPFRKKLDMEVASESELGGKIDGFRRSGSLVPNDIILPLVDSSFEETKDSEFLFLDGLPRNLAQLPFAIERARHFGFGRITAVHIQTPADIAYSRLLARGRDEMDTDPTRLLRRMQVFEEETLPLIAHISRESEKLGIEYHMICGINLRRNMPKYVRLLMDQG